MKDMKDIKYIIFISSSGSITVAVPLRFVIKLRFRFRHGKKLRFLLYLRVLRFL
jgi:hypothetical protein